MKSEPRRGSEWLKQRNRAREIEVEPLDYRVVVLTQLPQGCFS